jgi:uncharacterized OsmC-like protein
VIVHQIKLGRLATATTESGLRVKAIEPKGESLVTNMPVGIGGGNTAPTPGWYLGAALANCDATMIALRASQIKNFDRWLTGL